MKAIFVANDIPTAQYVTVSNSQTHTMVQKNIEDKLKYPLIVKPSRLGSSIGITVCKSPLDLSKALDLAYEFDNRVLVEEFVDGAKEVNVALIGDKINIDISQTEQPITIKEILSFEDKYLSNKKTKGSSKRKMPADISAEQTKEIENIGKKLFEIFDLKGVVRIDFLISKEGKVLVNEINSLPGSLAFYLFKWSFKKHINNLIDIADRSQVTNKVVYKSKILDNYIN